MSQIKNLPISEVGYTAKRLLSQWSIVELLNFEFDKELRNKKYYTFEIME